MVEAAGRPAAGRVLRRLVVPVYWPIFITNASAAMLIPVLPLYLRDEGLSYTAVSVVLAAAGLGGLMGGLPAGSVMSRVGSEALLAVSVGALVVTTLALPITTAALALVAFRFVYGLGTVGLFLSRQTFVTEGVPGSVRGRAMSFAGGAIRLGVLAGPAVGGLCAEALGYDAAFVIAGAVAGLGWVAAPVHRHLTNRGAGRAASAEKAGFDAAAIAGGAPAVSGDAPGVLKALWRYRRRLLRGGFGPLLAMTVRDGRFVVLPLIAADVGLSPAAVGLVVAVGTGADLCCFPLSGLLMDRFGRLFAIVPAFSLMAGGFLLLGVGRSAVVVTLAGVVIGIGNGMGAGTMLTLGSDLAPPEATGQFLAGMATMTHVGRLAGPLVVGVTADAAGLGTAAVVLSVVLVSAIAWIVLAVGETARQHHR